MSPDELIQRFNLIIHIQQLPPETEGGTPIWKGTIKNQYGEAVKIVKGRRTRPTKQRMLEMLVDEGKSWKSPCKRWIYNIGLSYETPELKERWEILRNNTLQLSKMTEEKWKEVRW